MERLDDYLLIREAAEFLGVSPNTLRNWGREKKVPEFRHPVNNYRLYRKSDLEGILRQVGRSAPACSGPEGPKVRSGSSAPGHGGADEIL